ncbi:hypothetical protein [Rhodococcus sp. NPDC060176]|uniref:hypothetical protein n=1 Tax=Rhodococcus sp. NPDC060176 TaxID=3347062 RepID=UPI003664B5D5
MSKPALTGWREEERVRIEAKKIRDARYKKYTGFALPLLSLAAKRNISAADFMDEYNPAELDKLNASAYTTEVLEGAVIFLTDLLEWSKGNDDSNS